MEGFGCVVPGGCGQEHRLRLQAEQILRILRVGTCKAGGLLHTCMLMLGTGPHGTCKHEADMLPAHALTAVVLHAGNRSRIRDRQLLLGRATQQRTGSAAILDSFRLSKPGSTDELCSLDELKS